MRGVFLAGPLLRGVSVSRLLPTASTRPQTTPNNLLAGIGTVSSEECRMNSFQRGKVILNWLNIQPPVVSFMDYLDIIRHPFPIHEPSLERSR